MVDAARPSNVQALRALFAQKEKTVIDGLKVPKNLSSEEISQDESQNTSNSITNGSDSEQSNPDINRLSGGSASTSSSSPTLPQKPPVGPKPIFSKTQIGSTTNQQGIKSLVSQLEGSNGMYTSKTNLCSANSIKITSSQESVKSLESENLITNCDKPSLKLNGETHATLIKKETLSLLIPSPDAEFNEIVIRKANKAPPKPIRNSLINVNNISPKKYEYRRKILPSLDILGAAPLKPIRPNFVTVSLLIDEAPPLPERNEYSQKVADAVISPPPLPDRILSNNRQSVPPPRPSAPPPNTKGPPNRPPPTPPISSEESPIDEELYCDTMDPERAQSLIAEYTEEEECGTRRNSVPIRPKNPPPPPPSQSSILPSSFDDNSHDTQGSSSGQDDIYEEMPFDSNKGPVYSNSKDQEKYGNLKDQEKYGNSKDLERQRKEAEKRSKRELKEKEKHEKMCEKLRKKYGLTGEEIPLDAGIVKSDCRGSKTDLTVHKGETVLILRMENNPIGKWLAKNEKGKIGYVDLANIEVDADSVKSVMKVRVSLANEEDVYSEIQTEDVYECTY